MLKRKNDKELIKWLVFILGVGILQFLYVYIFFIEPYWIIIRTVKIIDPLLSSALSGIKVIQLSDLHIERIGLREILLIEKVNKLKPDLIFITGDLLGSSQGLSALWNFLILLEAKFHTYIVLGDTDSILYEIKSPEQWNRANVFLLDDKAIRVNLREKENTFFWLAGVSLGSDLERVIKNVPLDEPVILLSHRPEIIKSAALKKINLVLAGHTHGGQVGISFLRELFPYARRSSYIEGLYKVKETFLYVNRGIGSEKGIRFLCWPEITVFEFLSRGKNKYKVLPQDR